MNNNNKNVYVIDDNTKLIKELILLHNKANYLFTIWTEDCKFVDCNDATLTFLGLKPTNNYIEKISNLIPKFQLYGFNSLEIIKEHLYKNSDTKSFCYDSVMKKLDGAEFPVYIALQKIKIKDTFFIASYQFDLTSVDVPQINIKIRNKLLNAINEVSELLLMCFENIKTDVDIDKVIFDMLEILGTASRADRCYIWQNYQIKDSSLVFMKQIYEWVEGVDEVQAVQDTEIIDHIVYDPTLYDLLSSGECLNSIVKDLDDYNRGILEDQGIKSILLAPVHIKNYFWGFIGFDNCHSEELWDKLEKEILSSASFMIATIIRRFETSNNNLM